MKHPIILEGKEFDWQEGGEYAKHVVDENGVINWRAAFFADPGVMKCPQEPCGAYLWAEGLRVRCPDCGHEFDTRNKELAESYAELKK